MLKRILSILALASIVAGAALWSGVSKALANVGPLQARPAATAEVQQGSLQRRDDFQGGHHANSYRDGYRHGFQDGYHDGRRGTYHERSYHYDSPYERGYRQGYRDGFHRGTAELGRGTLGSGHLSEREK